MSEKSSSGPLVDFIEGVLDTDTVEVGGIPLSYLSAGRGTPIVFVHGWSLEYRTWQMQIDAFRKGHRVIAYNYRGSGTSGGGHTRYSFDDLTKELDGFLDEIVGDERPVLVGHSLGAALVLQYLAEHPDRCRGVVAADIGLPVGIPKLHEIFSALFEDIAVHLFGLDATTEVIASFLWSPEYAQRNPAVLAMAAAQYQTNSAASLVHSYFAFIGRPDVEDKLRETKVPTLLIIGSEDKSVSLASMQLVQQSIPGSRLEIIQGSGHMTYVEQPEAFNSLLAGFLDGL